MSSEPPEINPNFVTYLLNKASKIWWNNPNRKSNYPFISIKVYDFEVREKIQERHDGKTEVHRDVVPKGKRESKTVKYQWKKTREEFQYEHYTARPKPKCELFQEIVESKEIEVLEHEKMVVDVSYVGSNLFYDDHCKLPYGACIRSTRDEFVEVEKTNNWEPQEKKIVLKAKPNKNDFVSIQFVINDIVEIRETPILETPSECDCAETYQSDHDEPEEKIGFPLFTSEDQSENREFICEEPFSTSKLDDPKVIEYESNTGLLLFKSQESVELRGWESTMNAKDEPKEKKTPLTLSNCDFKRLFELLESNEDESQISKFGFDELSIKTAKACVEESLDSMTFKDHDVIRYYRNLDLIKEESEEKKKTIRVFDNLSDCEITKKVYVEMIDSNKDYERLFSIILRREDYDQTNNQLRILGYSYESINTARSCVYNQLKALNVVDDAVICWFMLNRESLNKDKRPVKRDTATFDKILEKKIEENLKKIKKPRKEDDFDSDEDSSDDSDDDDEYDYSDRPISIKIESKGSGKPSWLLTDDKTQSSPRTSKLITETAKYRRDREARIRFDVLYKKAIKEKNSALLKKLEKMKPEIEMLDDDSDDDDNDY